MSLKMLVEAEERLGRERMYMTVEQAVAAYEARRDLGFPGMDQG